MKHQTFFWFVLPSSLAMLLFIAMPIVSVITQSLYTSHEQVIVEVENCGPFGCTKSVTIDQEATEALRDAEPLGKFAGAENYLNRSHLASGELGVFWTESDGFGDFFSKVFNLPLYRALAFTLTFTFVVTPLTIVLGFIIAVAVNSATQVIRGPLIFFSLLPMIITPLIGSLILFWMVDARGILGARACSGWPNDPTLVRQSLDPADRGIDADGLRRLARRALCLRGLLRRVCRR